MLEDLLPYYENELTSLRALSREFAGRYPRIAARLLLEGDVCEDPHVERLIEGFAFIAARIHKKLDDEFPQITEALLSVLYPHFLRPVPSMSIAQLAPANGTELTAAQTIPRGAQLLTRPVRGIPVRYRTAYPVEVQPLRVTEARFESIEHSAFAASGNESAAVVRIRLEAGEKAGFDKLDVRQLRFHIDGESPLVHALYELVLNHAAEVIITAPEGEPRRDPVRLPASAIRAVGFDADEGLLDYDPRSFLGYRLLQEYFVLPEKFLFFDVAGLALNGFARRIDLHIRLAGFGRPERTARLEQTVGADTFRLNCTPIINLFPQQSEPIRVTGEIHEYPVVPDVRRPQGLEVYSIDAVHKLVRSGDRATVTEFLPFFSTRHGLHGEDSGYYWYAQRSASVRPGDDGTEMKIALVDRDMNPAVPAIETLSLKLTCTNRDLPSQLPFGGAESMLAVENGGAIAQARLLKKPTPTWRAPLRQANQWRLISHLALNHLSIADASREALLEILSLYNYSDSASLRKQIGGITAVHSRPAAAHIGTAPRQAFVRGTEIELTFDENQYVGAGVYLLARVLDVFFGLYCTANSWTRLSVRTQQREEVLARFAARSGALPLV